MLATDWLPVEVQLAPMAPDPLLDPPVEPEEELLELDDELLDVVLVDEPPLEEPPLPYSSISLIIGTDEAELITRFNFNRLTGLKLTVRALPI